MSKSKRTHLMTFFVTIVAIVAIIVSLFNDIKSNLILGLDLQGGFEILYEVSPLSEEKQLPEMSAVVKSISKRINVLGVSEPEIIIEGDNRIRVQLAGVSDQSQARRVISSTANLSFRDVNDTLLADATIIQEGGASLAFQDGKPIVSLKIADTAKFKEITSKLASATAGNNLIVTWLDFEEGDSYTAELQKANQGLPTKYISVAGVNKAIDGDAIIEGNFTEAEARELADLISSGSLPVKMTEISSNVVSADYGLHALNKTALAGMVGILAIVLFMIFVYRIQGVIATIMFAVYMFAVFFIYSSIGAVFTLTGIAALVLGIGMTVDANIITFERVKDELYKGHSVKNAVKMGQSTSFMTIFDAQITTLIAGFIMYIFGNGAVKGFATMLIITSFMTLLLNVGVSRFLMNQLVNSGCLDNRKSWFNVKTNLIPDLNKNEEQRYFGPMKKYDYMKIAPKQILISVGIMVLAVVMMIVNHASSGSALNLGIDFSSGTKITVVANESIHVEDVQAEFKQLGYQNAKYQISGEETVNITIKESLQQDQILKIKETFKLKYGIEPNDNVVTPVVGRDLVRNAFLLSILAWLAMLVYITVRFKWDYGVSCIVALLHDVLIVVSVFAIFRIEINTEFVSVILAIIGYSINNSIVVFDRVREELEMIKKPVLKANDYRDVVNNALHHTMVRSIFSSVTTILPVIFLLLIGSNAIFVFNLAFFVGLIAGTISSIFVSQYVWLYIRTHYTPKPKQRKKFKEDLDEMTIKGINA